MNILEKGIYIQAFYYKYVIQMINTYVYDTKHNVKTLFHSSGQESPLPIFPTSRSTTLRHKSTPLQDAIQSVYTILVNQLCVKDIRENLFAKEIIDMPLNQTIQNKSNSKDANEALVDHLYTNGTVGSVKRFIQVLRDTSLMYAVHKEIAETLEGALSDHNVTVQSLPVQPEVSFTSTVCTFLICVFLTRTNPEIATPTYVLYSMQAMKFHHMYMQ